MGRVKIQMKKIEDKTKRHVAFAKRKNGIVKKAFELSTLCDVEIALILFSPAGKLFLFYAKKRVEETLQKFLDLPEYKRGCLRNETLIQRLVSEMELESIHRQLFSSESIENTDGCNNLGIHHHQIRSEEIQQEINKCSLQLADVEEQLQYFLNNANNIKSIDEIEYHEKILQETLRHVLFQKQYLESKNGVPPNSGWSSQNNTATSKF